MMAKNTPFRGVVCGLLALAFCAPALGGASSFQGLGYLPGEDGTFSRPKAISADGMVVVGEAQLDADIGAFQWASSDGMSSLGDLPGGFTRNTAFGASSNGAVIVGNGFSANGAEAFRWTDAGGLDGLGFLSGGSFSIARGCSGDGAIVMGHGSSSMGSNEAFRWTDTDGMVGMGDLSGGAFDSRAHAISANGNVIVGMGLSASGREAFRWTGGNGMVGLGDLPGDFFSSSANATNANGSVVVGNGRSASGQEAFRWTSGGGMVGLGDLPGGAFSSVANAVNGDGSVIVGKGDSGGFGDAFIWDEANGMQNLKEVLENEYGLDLTGWTLNEATGISDDGLAITGIGTNPDGFQEGWIAVLDAGTPAHVANFTIQTGTHISGNTAKLRESDNRFLKIESEFIEGVEPPYVMIVEVKLTSEVLDPESLHILVESKLSQNGGTAKLYLRNWLNGGWTRVATDPIGKTEMIQKVGGLDPDKYISASGVIKLRIRHQKMTSSNGDPFRSLIDHVQALVR